MQLLALTAGCTPGSLGVGISSLEVPELVEAEVIFGQPNVIGVELKNHGTADAEVTARVDEPLVVAADVVVIPAGGAAPVPVSYTPEDYAAVTATLNVRTTLEEYDVALVVFVNPDADADGYLAVGATGDDCDDTDATRYPGAPERCDGVDQDCDGEIDEDPQDPPMWYPDADHDGFGDADAQPIDACVGPDGALQDASDCDDADPLISPLATEIWYDGVDQDCDGNDADQDRDGFVSADHGGDDCDDFRSSVHPGALEVWYDGIDQDCDGNDDDQDLDGYAGDAGGPDCDDEDPEVHPGADEVDDAVDQDCDGHVDEGTWDYGDLIVSEVLADPVAVNDDDGRFLELYNASLDDDIDLGAVVVSLGPDDQALSAGFLGPGAAIVLCTSTDPLVNGGITCDDPMPWNAGKVNRIEVRGDGVVLDSLPWNPFEPTPAGASLELAAAHLYADDNDVVANWCTATAVFGAGDLGTPGAVVSPCP